MKSVVIAGYARSPFTLAKRVSSPAFVRTISPRKLCVA